MAITKQNREKAEALIIKTFDKLDKSKTNSNYYKQMFAGLSDKQFEDWMKKKFPIRLHLDPSKVNPSMDDAKDALNVLHVPLMEKVSLPYLYTNKDGKPVDSLEALVVYVHLKKVQQFITKKNKWSTSISNRDMKTGLLLGADKGAITSDREFESLATLSMDKTMEELAGPRGDAMNAKNAMYSVIGSTGMVRLSDLPKDRDDSLAKNLFNTYLLGAHISSNLVDSDNYSAYTLRKKKNLLTRT